jgi:hypothetical protein
MTPHPENRPTLIKKEGSADGIRLFETKAADDDVERAQ